MSDLSKTPRWQRVGIWIVAIAMIVGTIAGLIFMILATQNSEIDPNTIAQEEYNKQIQEQYEEYTKQQEEERKKNRALEGYEDKVGTFNADDVKELTVETLKEGDGATISDSDTVKVNYTGWTPDGAIFDSTKKDGEDASPTSLSLSQVVDGWKEGLAGKKVGGTYLLSLPADKAYGETGSGDGYIPANTPIKFIVEVISIEK